MNAPDEPRTWDEVAAQPDVTVTLSTGPRTFRTRQDIRDHVADLMRFIAALPADSEPLPEFPFCQHEAAQDRDRLTGAIRDLDAAQRHSLLNWITGYCPDAVARGLSSDALDLAGRRGELGKCPDCGELPFACQCESGEDVTDSIAEGHDAEAAAALAADIASGTPTLVTEDEDDGDGGCVTVSPAGSVCLRPAGHDLIGGTPHRDLNGRAWDDDGWVAKTPATVEGILDEPQGFVAADKPVLRGARVIVRNGVEYAAPAETERLS